MPPASPSATYQWSVIAGPGNGTFDDSTKRDPLFTGTAKCAVTIKVEVTDAGETCYATETIHVVEVNDLSSDPDEIMDTEYNITESIIPNDSAPSDELGKAVIAPPEDSSSAFQWDIDFKAEVDHTSGDVRVIYFRDGVYILQGIKCSGAQNAPRAAYFNAGDGITTDKKCKDGKHVVAPAPTADLILICSNTTHDASGFLANARGLYSAAGGYQPISSVNGPEASSVVKRIEAFHQTHNNFSVLIVDHGNVGVQCMCAGDTYSANDGKHLDSTTAADLTAFKNALKNNTVTSVTFAGCCVANGTAAQNWMQEIANDGDCSVTAYPRKLTYTTDKKFEQRVGHSWVTKTDQTP